MIINPQVPLHRLVLSLCDALDGLTSNVADHGLRTAYVATNAARHLGIDGERLRDVFHAAALHDIGVPWAARMTPTESDPSWQGIGGHAEAGYALLCQDDLFEGAARIVRCHHLPWDGGRSVGAPEPEMLLAGQIVHLADVVASAFSATPSPLQLADQLVRRVQSLSGQEFHPDVAEAFCSAARPEAFWLNCSSRRIYGLVTNELDWPTVTIDVGAVERIANIFGQVVDGLSPWTATHSAGVAACAQALAERLSFSPREAELIHGAGYLHDLGKLMVPTSVLDKPGKLDAAETAMIQEHSYHTHRILSTIGGMPQISEWSSFHHERLDGEGYPFHHGAKDLTLGSRVMAVADTFAALAEDRPYRPGMSRPEALKILDELVRSGGRDGDVVAVIHRDYDEIDGIRCTEQADYAARQQQRGLIVAHPGASSAA